MPVSRVNGAIALRKEQLHRLAEELGPGVAEKLLDLRVDGDDAAGAPDDDDAFRYGLEEAPRSRLAPSEGLLHADALGRPALEFSEPLPQPGQLGQ